MDGGNKTLKERREEEIREEEMKRKRQNLDVNDINEALADEGNDVGDEEIELSSMIKQMEIDQES